VYWHDALGRVRRSGAVRQGGHVGPAAYLACPPDLPTFLARGPAPPEAVTVPAVAPDRRPEPPAPHRRRVSLTRPLPHRAASGLPAWWAAVPTGSVPARSQAGWLSAATAAIDAADLRSDADAALRALVWTLARWADWTRPAAE
jgi:hypothetical protein